MTNNGVVFGSWGLNFCFGAIQDIFFIQLISIFVIHVVAMAAIRPQLQYIYRVLNRVAVAFAQDDFIDDINEIKVVQVSTTITLLSLCKQLSVVNFYFTKKAKISFLSFFQHLSPACRAAKLKVAENLASARILCYVNDLDREICQTNYDYSLNLMALLVICLPVVIGVISSTLADSVLKTALAAVFSFYIVANDYLLSSGLKYIIILYFGLLALFIWRYLIYKPALTRVRTLAYNQYLSSTDHSPDFSRRMSGRMSGRIDRRILNQFSRQQLSKWSTSRRKRQHQKLAVQICSNFSTILNRISYTIVHLDLRRFYNYFRAQKQLENDNWMMMNRPYHHHGMVSTEEIVNHIRRNSVIDVISSELDEKNDESFRYIPSSNNYSHSMGSTTTNLSVTADKLIANRLPQEIKDMRRSEWTIDWGIDQENEKFGHGTKSDYVTELLNAHLFRYKFEDTKTGLHLSADGTLTSSQIGKKENTVNFQRRMSPVVYSFQQNNLETTDMDRALLAMYRKFIKAQWTTDGFYDYENLNDVLSDADKNVINAPQLYKIMDEIFKHYYPSDEKLSSEERVEVLDDFHQWFIEQTAVMHVDLFLDSMPTKQEVDRLPLSFVQFKDWFVNLSQHIIRCRTAMKRKLAAKDSINEHK